MASMMNAASLYEYLELIVDSTEDFFLIFSFPNFGIMFLIILVCAYLQKSPHLYDRDLWGTSLMVFCMVMTSGQIYNNMNRPYFAKRINENRIELCDEDFNDQYRLESYFFLLVTISMSYILIQLLDIPSKKEVASKEKRYNIIMYGIMWVLLIHGFLLLAAVKYRGYPFISLIFFK